jgi:lysozyme
MSRQICKAAVDLIKKAESLRLKAYLCPAGVPTIGYGHTGTDVTMADVGKKTITETDAEHLLAADLDKFTLGVDSLVYVPLSENQRGALVSFAFNLGLGNLRKSTLLKRLNDAEYQDAGKQFLVWDKATVNGKLIVLGGLKRRRAAEKALFDTPDDE